MSSSLSSSTNVETMMATMERRIMEKVEQASQQGIEAPPTLVIDSNDSEARMCTVCWLNIESTDTLWVATDCKPHQHIFHADCLATWWYSNGRRYCARCVQPVPSFTVHGRFPEGPLLFRSYKAANPNDNRVAMQHLIVEQSELLDILASMYEVDVCVSTCSALCPWQKPESLAGDGMTRAAKVFRACHDYLAKNSIKDMLDRGEEVGLRIWCALNPGELPRGSGEANSSRENRP